MIFFTSSDDHFFLQKILIFTFFCDIIELPNKLNIQFMGVFFFSGIFIPFLAILFYVEFDKMQIPHMKKYSNIPNLYMVCLATTGICVFVRGFGRALFIFGGKNGEEQYF